MFLGFNVLLSYYYYLWAYEREGGSKHSAVAHDIYIWIKSF
jgi:hypothetical protein